MRLLVLLAAFTLATAAHADTARSRMEAFSRDLKSVTATFDQSVTDANGEKHESSHGTLALDPAQVHVFDATGAAVR